MAQLNYNEQAVAFAGLLGSMTKSAFIEAGVLGGATDVAFGFFLVESAGLTSGTGTGTSPLSTEGTGPVYVLPSAAAANAAIGVGGWRGGGFLLHSHEYDKRLDFDANGLLLPTRQVNILKRGRVWVNATTAMAINDPVYARYTVNGALLPGSIGNIADSAKAQLLWGARVVTPNTAPGFVEIEWDSTSFTAGDQAP